MDKNIRIIINPKVGKQTAKTVLFTPCDRFCAMQDTIQVYITQYAGHAQKLAEASEGCCDILVCIGGDGAWSRMINDTMKIDSRPVPAHLPSGTISDFAATLKLPKNTGKFIDTIVQYRPSSCDIGQFNDRYFTYVAALGIFTEISYSTP